MTDQEREILRAISYIRACRNAGMGIALTIDKSRSHFILNALEEVLQYRAIGTVGRCRAAMEKCTPKIPNTWGDGCDAEGRTIYDMYDCPNCGKSYEIDYEKYDHCPSCGQAINWSGLEESGGESDE